jgi:hypothetical protein
MNNPRNYIFMRYNSQTNLWILLILFLFVLLQCTNNEATSQSDYNTIRSNFSKPTDDNVLWCYWYWIGDDISKEGITKDLEAMKKAGIGGALIGNINPEEKDGKVPLLSEFWWEHMVHAVNEGKRLGVEIGSFNCPGWSQSGGPWIKPEMAMRYITYSETKITGGKNIEIKLTKPTEEFQDIYVLAYPAIESEDLILNNKNASITVTPKIKDAFKLLDNDTTSMAGFLKSVEKYQIDIAAKQAFNARSLQIVPSKDIIKARCEILAEVNGKYESIKSFTIDRSKLTPNVGPNRYAPILVALPKTKATNFKIKFDIFGGIFRSNNSPNTQNQVWKLAEITISAAPGLEDYAHKTLGKMHPTPFPAWDSYLWQVQPNIAEKEMKVAPGSVLDISDKMNADGTLIWNAPLGNWIIQRYGMTPTGTKNSPSAPQGKGYEVDKANKELIQFHYDQYIGELLRRIPKESKSAFKYVIADSYEMGSQNWTDGYEAKFEVKFGYNPKVYLPVFSGRIVGSVEKSERFLWDLRRSVADAVAYEYTGGLREASNQDNLQLWLENYGHWGFPSEFLMYGGQSDLVSGEFWNEGSLGDIECKSASSAAHIYGKNRVSAEAFTAAQRTYVRHPAMLKKRGDWSLTEGINHFVLHLYIHQPDDERVPGVNAWFSTEFNRHNTWFEKAKSYFEYLRRCQYLLQQGNYAADVCYFIGENTPIMTGVRNPELPEGYAYDYINAEVILNRLSVKNGKFVLPDGMTYSLMVLPPFETMRPELLTKIESLVNQGGKIFGQAPTKSPSLKNYPESDKIVKSLSSKMWSNSENGVITFGKGTIVDGLSLPEALDHFEISKDVDLQSDVPVLWTHRTMPGIEVYFLTNQSNEEINLNPSFRVSGLKPQLWDAISGEIKRLPAYSEKNGRTSVPIKMKGLQSWFIVFIDSNMEEIDSGMKENFPEEKIVLTMKEPWKVDFQNKDIGPVKPIVFPTLSDWTRHDNEKIKYYSGTAIYTSTFNYKKEKEDQEIIIELGDVGVIASVKINGKEIGTTWIAPFRLNTKNSLLDGENTISIEVVNVWRNRLTGDKLLPEDNRTTWLLVDRVNREEELVTSGLLGPVTFRTVQ